MHNNKREWCVEKENDDVHYTLCTRNLKTSQMNTNNLVQLHSAFGLLLCKLGQAL
jgi:hypothetical protein